MCVFKYHAFIYFLRPPPWYGTSTKGLYVCMYSMYCISKADCEVRSRIYVKKIRFCLLVWTCLTDKQDRLCAVTRQIIVVELLFKKRDIFSKVYSVKAIIKMHNSELLSCWSKQTTHAFRWNNIFKFFILQINCKHISPLLNILFMWCDFS
jgi:hypothetical protein